MPALAAAGPVECAKVISAKVLEMPASANKTRGKKRRFQSVLGKEKKSKGRKLCRRWWLRGTVEGARWARWEGPGPGLIADPGASSIIGQTPHRQDDMPVNIDRNEGAQKATCSITLSDLEDDKLSA